MEKDSGHKLEGLAVDGGMSNSDLTMQTQANILGIPINRPVMRETTALGAAIAAGFAVNIWKEFGELKNINKEDRTIFKPQISKKKSNAMFVHWSHAVEMSKGWVRESEQEDDDEDEPAQKKDEEKKDEEKKDEEKKDEEKKDEEKKDEEKKE